VDYRCRTRTLLRAVGFAVGIAACAIGATTAQAGVKELSKTATSAPAINPWQDDAFDPSKPMIFAGGTGDEVVVVAGDRASPCTLGPANCYDRPPGTAPYPTFIVGQFNTQVFQIIDDFVPAANGVVNKICWLGQYSNATDCPVSGQAGGLANADAYGLFTVQYFLDDGFGFPGLPAGGPFSDTVGAGSPLEVTQGTTGNPIGFNNPTAIEVSFSATHADVPVTAGTCYDIQFNWTDVPGGPCFMIMTLSYENAEGNRRMGRRDLSTNQSWQVRDQTNLDTTVCIGNAAGTLALSPSNGLGACTNRVPPANDTPAAATDIPCGTSVGGADNSNATFDPTFAFAACRKNTTDPTDFGTADVWFKFTAAATNALISTCATAGLSGQVAGDTLMQVYKQTVVGPDFSPANLVLNTGSNCSDDNCTGGLSEVCATTVVGTTYYVRVYAFSPISQGKFSISVSCPCPVAANDLCSTAIAIPPNTDGSGPGWTSLTGRITLGNTAFGTTDGNVTSCALAPNTAKGIWYTIIGNGNQVRLSTDVVITGTQVDSRLSVYCSSDDTCSPPNGLTCLVANDDIDGGQNNFNSKVEFCAAIGKKYFILVHGFGSASGSFGLLAQQNFDSLNAPIACCDIIACDILCPFEIPQNTIVESAIATKGTGATPATGIGEVCTGTSAPTLNGTNAGCNNAAGPTRLFSPIVVGQTVHGDSRSSGGSRDIDWYVSSGMPVNQGFIIDYSFSAQGPQRLFPAAANFNFSLCQTITFLVNNTTFCGQVFNVKTFRDTKNQIPLSGAAAGTGDEFLWQIRNNGTSDGYPCGASLNQYWFRINYVMGFAECAPVSNPAGVAGVNFDDERDAATIDTFDGTVGFSGIKHEPCFAFEVPANPLHRSKGGCNIAPASRTDGDFIKITPNRPMIGVMDGATGSAGATRDVDWYKFEIPLGAGQQLVNWKVECGGPVQFFLQNNTCADLGGDITETYSTVATLGHCGARCLDTDDTLVLQEGVYIVVGIFVDAFGGGNIFANVDCHEPGELINGLPSPGAEIGVAKYKITLNMTPVPTCSVTVPGGATVENEGCPTVFTLLGDSCVLTNDGCASPGGTFAAGTLTPGTPVAGSLFSQFNDDINVQAFTIDTDYWQFTVAARSLVTFSAASDGPVQVLLARTGPSGSLCDSDLPNPFTNQGGGLRVMASKNADLCTVVVPTTGSVYLAPGTYSLILTAGSVETGASFGDLRCLTTLQLSYTASVSVTPVGSCTVGSDCLITTAAGCSGLGGSFVADAGAACIANNAGLTASAFNAGCSAYSSIMGIGTQVTLCGDNEQVAQAIPPFKYFGRTYTQVNISTNGYITFGSNASSDIVRKFADNGNPNAIVAPFWNDWKVACQNAVGVSGSPTSVWVQTTGALGSEVTIIEWKNLRKFLSFAQSASFQVVLKHATREIEFRYGGFTGLNKKDLSRMAVGLEDDTGFRGVDVALTGAFLSGNSCIKFGAAAPPPCNGDANGDGQVNFADITAVLSNWQTNGANGGDANHDGVVNFADITTVLSNWQQPCPV